MKLKLSATFSGKCDICGKKAKVFAAGDEDTKKVVTICKKCSDKLGNIQTSEVIEKYGKKDEEAFREGVKLERRIEAG
ncbi:MAG: hypothetical protein QXQ18_00490 [Candidatus Aenigmatarchaeota archaeon]